MQFKDYYQGNNYDSIDYKIAVMKWYRDGGDVSVNHEKNKTRKPDWDWCTLKFIPVIKKKTTKKRPYTLETLPAPKNWKKEGVEQIHLMGNVILVALVGSLGINSLQEACNKFNFGETYKEEVWESAI